VNPRANRAFDPSGEDMPALALPPRLLLIPGLIILGLGLAGCAHDRSANGQFSGTLSSFQAKTDDQRWHTVYLFHVTSGPPFREPDGSLPEKSVGTIAVLVRDRREHLYQFSGATVPTQMVITGKLHIGAANVCGGRVIELKGDGGWTDYCLQVKSIRPSP
jgi:hypothetical protein